MFEREVRVAVEKGEIINILKKGRGDKRQEGEERRVRRTDR